MTDVTHPVGAAPTVTDRDGTLTVEWPEGREDVFLIRSSLFEAMIADVNDGRRLAVGMARIVAVIGEFV